MQDAQTHTEHLFRFQQMPDIRTAICAAGRTLTSLFDRAHVLLVFLVEQIKFSVIGIYMSVTTISARIYTVKEIDTTLNTF